MIAFVGSAPKQSPWMLVKQPNGKFAVYERQDCLLSKINLKQMQAFNYAKQRLNNIPKAWKYLGAAIDDWPPGSIYVVGSGHDRWDHAMSKAVIAHGGSPRSDLYAVFDQCIDPQDREVVYARAKLDHLVAT